MNGPCYFEIVEGYYDLYKIVQYPGSRTFSAPKPAVHYDYRASSYSHLMDTWFRGLLAW
jgi:hypothetical protein